MNEPRPGNGQEQPWDGSAFSKAELYAQLETLRRELERQREQAEARERLTDPNHLPTRDEVFDAFGGNLDYEFTLFCTDKEHPVYELLTEDHMEALGSYLSGRAEELGASDGRPLTILEVGAGEGRLSHFLRQKLEAQETPARVIATDISTSRETNAYGLEPKFEVERLGYEEAPERYEPDIVVMSWMPYGYDWTPAFRATESVKEYVLIGETDGGCCGSDETWGFFYDDYYDYDDDAPEEEEYVPLFRQDGFEKEYLDEVSEGQLCRTDHGTKETLIKHSYTVSFKRQPQQEAAPEHHEGRG